jgi:hypothetical protein
MNELLKERTARMRAIFPQLENQSSLYGELVLAKHIADNLVAASKLVVYDCLISFYKGDSFDIDLPIEKFFKTYKEKIMGLQNITPNGLLLPKIEILNSINFFNKAVFALIEHIGLKGHGEIACPVNLRLNFGIGRGAEANARPKSSTFWHTDIWAGQNANELMVHTPIFGDFKKNGIAAALPPASFFPDFIKALPSYEAGSPVTAGLDAVAKRPVMKPGRSYIFDSFLLHKTISEGEGIRGIVSFPVKLKRKLKSDIYVNPLRDAEYQTYATWQKMGTETMLVSSKKIAAGRAKKGSFNTYADTFEMLSIKNIHDDRSRNN